MRLPMARLGIVESLAATLCSTLRLGQATRLMKRKWCHGHAYRLATLMSSTALPGR